MSVPSVGGASSLSRLAEMYRQQVSTGAGTEAGASTAQATATREGSFLDSIGKGLGEVEALDRSASSKAIKAATGDLTDVHDYVIAATQAQVATELTTTVRNKALEAFNDIMRMPL